MRGVPLGVDMDPRQSSLPQRGDETVAVREIDDRCVMESRTVVFRLLFYDHNWRKSFSNRVTPAARDPR